MMRLIFFRILSHIKDLYKISLLFYESVSPHLEFNFHNHQFFPYSIFKVELGRSVIYHDNESLIDSRVSFFDRGLLLLVHTNDLCQP
jgi:hypothetical protein